MDSDTLRDMPLWVIAFLISGSFHEYAHAWMATRLGDPTPEAAGRLTINPIPHIDIVGLVFIIIMTLSGFGIGWMKPVPVNPFNFRNPRRGMMMVALSGPISNLILVAFFVLLVKAAPVLIMHGNPVSRLVIIFLLLNVLLAVFNLFPVPPLDGSHIVEGLLPEKYLDSWEKIYPYGWIILLGLMFTGAFGLIFGPVINFVFNVLIGR
jgi:Zn-dependent protease